MVKNKFHFLFIYFFILNHFFSQAKSQTNLSEIKINNSQIIDQDEDTVSVLEEEEEELILRGGIDGSIHAFGTTNNLEKWQIFTGGPLFSSSYNSKFKEGNLEVFPGLYGEIFYLKNGIFKNLEFTVKDLIKKSPLKIPHFPEIFFVGNKETMLFLVNLENGEIISSSKISNEENFSYNNSSQNLITIIRINFVLKCYHHNFREEVWNSTYSEIMVNEQTNKLQIDFNSQDLIDKSNLFKDTLNENSERYRKLYLMNNFEKPYSDETHRIDSQKEKVKVESNRSQKTNESSFYKNNQKSIKFKNSNFWKYLAFTLILILALVISLIMYKKIRKLKKFKKRRLYYIKDNQYESDITDSIEDESNSLFNQPSLDPTLIAEMYQQKNENDNKVLDKFKEDNTKENLKKKNEKKSQSPLKNTDKNIILIAEKLGKKIFIEDDPLPSRDLLSSNNQKADLEDSFKNKIYQNDYDHNDQTFEEYTENEVEKKYENITSFNEEELNDNAIDEIDVLVQNEKSQKSVKINKLDKSTTKNKTSVSQNSKEKMKSTDSKKIDKNDDDEILIESGFSNSDESWSESMTYSRMSRMSKSEKIFRGSEYKKRNNISDFKISRFEYESNNISSKFENTEELKIKRNKILQSNSLLFDNGRFCKDFVFGTFLGKGGFGEVTKGKHKLDGSDYAIKRIELNVEVYNDLKELPALKEAKTMLKLLHKNVVRYFNCWFELKENWFNRQYSCKSLESKKSKDDTCVEIPQLTKFSFEREEVSQKVEIINSSSDENNETEMKSKAKSISEEVPSKIREDINSSQHSSDNQIDSPDINKTKHFIYFYMQMEYCGSITLHQFLDSRKDLDRKTIIYLFKQIVEGVAHIHRNKIIHRDLKPDNIFIIDSERNRPLLKIGDFGLATELTENSIKFNSKSFLGNVGTPLYQSPEQYFDRNYDQKVDIYALGLILYEMCSNFQNFNEKKAYLEKMRNNNNWIDNQKIFSVLPLECSLIKKMTNFNPDERPTAKQIIKSNEFVQLVKES